MSIGVTTYTTSDRLPLMPPGSSTDTWGNILNAALQRIEDAKDGVLSLNMSGQTTLVSANDTTDQAHYAVLAITGGSGGTLICPAVPKVYLVRVDASVSGNVSLSAGAQTAICYPGETSLVFCDGANFWRPFSVHNMPAPVNPNDAATKAYVDAAALAAQSSTLPGQTGNAGKVLTTNGSTASWQPVTESEVVGAIAFSVAMSLAL